MSSNNLLSNNEKRVICLLKDILDKYEIPQCYYSFDGYSEGSVCIEKIKGEKFIVYDAERANKYGITECKSILDACLILISRISYSKEDEIILSSEFKDNYDHL